jgi:hypothetical protein
MEETTHYIVEGENQVQFSHTLITRGEQLIRWKTTRRGELAMVEMRIGNWFVYHCPADEMNLLISAVYALSLSDSTMERVADAICGINRELRNYQLQIDAETASHENAIAVNDRFFEGVVNALIVSGLIAVCVVAWMLYGY